MLKQTHHIAKLLTLSLVISLSLVFAFPSTTNAATLLPVPGNDENTDNSSCSLTEAIENINNQNNANPDCLAGDGNDDTITLAIGTYTLTADLPQITESITIEGQGMGETILSADSQYLGISSEADGFFVHDLTITQPYQSSFNSSGGNVDIQRLELDGAGAAIGGGNTIMSVMGITSQNSSSDLTATISDIYIHDFEISADQIFGIGIVPIGANAIDAQIRNVTISNINNTQSVGATQVLGIILGTGMFDNGITTAPVSGSVTNTTITGLSSANGAVYGIGAAAISQDSNSADLAVTNSTISGLDSGGTGFLGDEGSSIMVFGAAEVLAEVEMESSNLVLSDSNVDNCVALEMSSTFGLSGSANLDITSSGGNLSDDSTCSSYFTHPTDQNNVSGLAASLDPLADNGGFVPTMALKANSPAIDSGVTVAGLTTDARGALRPQGNAYDSGAYESPFTRQEDSDTSQDTLAETGDGQGMYVLAGLLILSGGLILVRFQRMRV